MSVEKLVLTVDLCILSWLVFTWFYEGHHKRCSVEVRCGHCGETSEARCAADRRIAP